MNKPLVALVLLLLVSPVLADPTAYIDMSNITFLNNAGSGPYFDPALPATGVGVMTIQLDFQSLNGYVPTALCSAIGAEMTLTGVGASKFTPYYANVQGATVNQLAGYGALNGTLFNANWQGTSCTSAVQTDLGLLSPNVGVTYGCVNEPASHNPVYGTDLTTVTAGEVLAVFQFTYNGNATGDTLAARLTSIDVEWPLTFASVTDQGDISIAMSGYNPVLGFSDSTNTGIDVINNGADLQDAPFPEPATMSLLALGLAGLVIRRRKA